MNWDAISAIGELIGAAAVVISLIYLATQIRQNTRQIASNIEATQLAAFERNIESGNRTRELMLVHPELIELYMRGRKSYLNLIPQDRSRFALLVRNIFSETQGAYMRQSLVKHDPEGFDGLAKVVDSLISARGVQEFLQSFEPDWRPEFKQFVHARLELKDAETRQG